MESTIKAAPMTLEEYSRLYDAEGPFELIDGTRREIMPPVMIHVLTVQALLFILKQYCETHDGGRVFSEAPFVLQDDSQWVKGSRVPDLMVVTEKRWQQYVSTTKEWKSKPLMMVPDLVVEVVSQNDLYTDLQSKVDHYLRDGVQTVWVIDPNRKHAAIYRAGTYQPLTEDDGLAGEPLLPGLKIDLKQLFDIE